MWKINKGNWEYVAIDEPEGQVVIKNKKAKKEDDIVLWNPEGIDAISTKEIVLLDAPEGQVVVKKARKPRKKSNNLF
jgi:hypothetical protein